MTRDHETGAGVERDDKRSRILRAAIDTFAEKGYFNARVSDVAARAEVADGTIYLYFKGKEDLLLSIFSRSMRDYLRFLEERLEGLDDPADRLERLIGAHFESIGEDRNLAIVAQIELRHTQKFMALFSHRELAEYLEMIREIVSEGQRRAVFRSDVNPQLAAKAIFGVLDEMVTSWILSEKDEPLGAVAPAVTSLILGGLRK